MRFAIASFAIVLCFLAPAAFAQDIPKPGPEHEWLNKLVGTWDAVLEMQGQKSPGVMTLQLICGGMWLQSDYHGEIMGQEFSGHGLDCYDKTKKKYVSVWVDSLETSPMVSYGDLEPKTHTMTLTGDATGLDGKQQQYKSISHMKDDHHMSFTMIMVAADGSEKPVLAIEYTRRK